MMLLVVCIYATMMFGQDKIYVHTATETNVIDHITYINHPELNGNPDASIVFCQNWNPNGLTGVYNNNPTGLWYDGNVAQWAIFNENLVAMPTGTSFNVFIAEDSEVYTHVANDTNTIGNFTVFDIPDISQFSYLFFSNYWNPNAIYNPNAYGTWYTGVERSLYIQTIAESVPTGAAFKILRGLDASSILFTHTSQSSNISLNWTEIDHPELNENPNATFLYAHYWGLGGAQYEVYLPHHTGVWYTGSRWAIFNQDGAGFPENVRFDIIITNQQTLNVDTFEDPVFSFFPNPVKDILYFNEFFEIERLLVFNMLGQQVLEFSDFQSGRGLDMSKLQTGQYIAKVKHAHGFESFKFLKD